MRYLMKVRIFIILIVLFSCQKEVPVPSSKTDGSSPGSGDSEGGTSIVKVVPNDFLSAKKYDKLVVEIQYVEDYQPKAESVNNLKTFLEGLLNKPGGISVTQIALPSPGKASYTLTDIREVEKANRSGNTSGSTLSAYFFFADADFAENGKDSKVLGIAYGSTSMVIFEKTIREFSGGLTSPPVSTLESTVINHELAHILGLVNNGTPMQTVHQDEAHGRHCNDKNCLMYYAAETSDIIGNLVGGNVPKLDAKCIEDLKANGGK